MADVFVLHVISSVKKFGQKEVKKGPRVSLSVVKCVNYKKSYMATAAVFLYSGPRILLVVC